MEKLNSVARQRGEHDRKKDGEQSGGVNDEAE